jgi:flagellar motor protein MotB
MSGNFSVIRFLRSAAVIRMAALLAFSGLACCGLALSGCRSLSQRNSTSPPASGSPTPNVPKMEETDRYSAFRPIMPGQFVQSKPAQSSPVQEPPKVEPQRVEPKADIAVQSKIEELNKRISELEAQLLEAWKAQAPPPVIAENQPPQAQEFEAKAVKSLPIINREGVHVSSDEFQNVRIEVIDKALFLPNAWQLSAEGEETLRTIAAEMRASDSKAVIDIEGHTDSLMSDPNNPMQKHDISTAKSTAVMQFFMNALCWDVARIGTSSFGRSRPIADNGTPEGRARNNRIEIVVRHKNE